MGDEFWTPRCRVVAVQRPKEAARDAAIARHKAAMSRTVDAWKLTCRIVTSTLARWRWPVRWDILISAIPPIHGGQLHPKLAAWF